MKKTVKDNFLKRLFSLLAILLVPVFLFAQQSNPTLPERSGGKKSPYPLKYINVAGYTVEYEKDVPQNILDEIKAKKENAFDDIIAVYEQVDWSLYGDASCLDRFLIHGLNEIMGDELKNNKKARSKLKAFLKSNPDTNTRFILLALLNEQQIIDSDVLNTAVHFTTDSVREVRLQAIKVLSTQKSNECIPHLKKVLANEPDKYLKILAAGGLAELDDNEGYSEMEKALEDTDAVSRVIAAQYLGQVKTARSRAILEKAIAIASKNETNPSVKTYLADSLRKVTGQPGHEIWEKYFGKKR